MHTEADAGTDAEAKADTGADAEDEAGAGTDVEACLRVEVCLRDFTSSEVRCPSSTRLRPRNLRNFFSLEANVAMVRLVTESDADSVAEAVAVSVADAVSVSVAKADAVSVAAAVAVSVEDETVAVPVAVTGVFAVEV